jgi:hypothetical protein
MARDFLRLPDLEEIRLACSQIQQAWTDEDRKKRQGDIGQPAAPTVRQFLVHHQELGRWIGGRRRSVRVWRCVDGR